MVFAKEVLNQLPMEFAVEAQKLAGDYAWKEVWDNEQLQPDGHIVMNTIQMTIKNNMLTIKNLQAGIEGKANPERN